MTVVKAPLFSFGAKGKIADSLVYFGWKGLNVVRSWVKPANPKTTAQVTQRGYLTAAVAAIHAAQALAAQPLVEADASAYALLGSTHPTPRTWFNEAVKRWVDQEVAGLKGIIYRNCGITEGDGQCTLSFWCTEGGANEQTAGTFWYGTSKTALVNSEAGVDAGDGRMTATVTGLTNGVKYFFQLRPSAHADFAGVRSGIYHATPAA